MILRHRSNQAIHNGRKKEGRSFVNSAHRLPVLDGLRAISILLVLAAHMVPVGPSVLGLNYTVGAMGMSLFFALSGFLDSRQGSSTIPTFWNFS